MMARGEKKGEEEEEVEVEVLLPPRLLPLPAFFLSPFPKWLLDYCGSNSKGEREREASALTHHLHLLHLLLQPGGGEESPGQRSPGIGGGTPGRAGGDWARADGRADGRAGGGQCLRARDRGNSLSIPDKTFGSTSFLCGRRGGCTHFTPCCCPTFISR